MTNDISHQKQVSSKEYTRDYYQKACDGSREFEINKGLILPRRLSIPFEAANLEIGDCVIDLGCGRGEVLIHTASKGAYPIGFDYSSEAVTIASQNIKNISLNGKENIQISMADAKNIPIKSDSIDVVFMLDIVEHLYPNELHITLDEVRRVLKVGGKLVIHTMPNIWYYRYIYPIYRMIQKLRRLDLPINPRDRWDYIHVHVNEQSPISLYKALKLHGFKTKVWLTSTQDYHSYDASKIMKIGMNLLSNTKGINYLFCNDIFGLAIKQS